MLPSVLRATGQVMAVPPQAEQQVHGALPPQLLQPAKIYGSLQPHLAQQLVGAEERLPVS